MCVGECVCVCDSQLLAALHFDSHWESRNEFAEGFC